MEKQNIVLLSSLKPGQLFRAQWPVLMHECTKYPLETYSWVPPSDVDWYVELPKDSVMMLVDIQTGFHQERSKCWPVRHHFFRAYYFVFLCESKRLFKFVRRRSIQEDKIIIDEGLVRVKN